MIYLLDTHTFIWTILDNKKLSKKAKEIIIKGSNEILVSTLTFWEISLKTSIGKFTFNGLDVEKLDSYAESQGFTIITLEPKEAQSYSSLEKQNNHKDPFDRMLIWQSICRNVPIISKDSFFNQYEKLGLKVIW